MIILFFFYIILTIICLILLSILIILFSNIQIHICNIKILSDKKDGRYLNKNYKIEIKLYIFNVIRVIKINLTKDKIEREKMKTDINKFGEKLLKKGKKFDIEMFKILNNIQINDLNLNIVIGLEDAATCAICIGMLSTVIAIALKNIMNKNNNFWKITPIYQDKNILSIDLDCIVKFKTLNILKSIISAEKNLCLNNNKMGNI